MCTSICYRPDDVYFGRTLDAEFSFREQVVITPRRYRFALRHRGEFRTRFAMIGMASVAEGVPLYYEAVNEKGLGLAGLNFPGNAKYLDPKDGADNIAPFELIPWILGQAATVREARALLERIRLVSTPFAPEMPLSPLHFMLSDAAESIVAEPTEEGLRIYGNPYDVMTNNPPFDYHLWNLQNYLNLSPEYPESRFSPAYALKPYAVGMGTAGLPGDASSASRFVRGAFHLANASCEGGEEAHVSQFFHILDSVAMVKGTVRTAGGKEDLTLYSCCVNATKGIYYYKTCGNSRITAVALERVDPDAPQLFCYDLRRGQDILCDN